jgi:hypothetical protein
VFAFGMHSCANRLGPLADHPLLRYSASPESQDSTNVAIWADLDES